MTLYKKQCLSCHAADLGGLVGPSLQQVGTRLTEEQIMEKIRDGAKGMPSFEKLLSPEDLEALAQWLSTKKEGTESFT
ncbi:c-type cytochrome [Brevibacillus sp. NRS-1366]|uniref:c-type cytochrome n=1 Tax=Brevibacillus sp. NRS-1366 TaxID=3233899 RepID=UPI003D1A37DE